MAEARDSRELRIGPEGHVRARLYDARAPQAGIVMVGGIGGGFDTPAQGLYPRLGRHLSGAGIDALQVAFRLPGELSEGVLDAAAGVHFLVRRGCERVGLVGHSFGGAVVLRAGAALPEVAAVVTLSTQSYGTDRLGELAGRPVLLVHGVDDEILPADCSVHVFERSGEPKELRLIPGARHVLDEAADEVYRIVHDFLARHLAGRAAAHPT